MEDVELQKLEESLERIHELAIGFDLDFFETRFEVVPADVMYTFGAYGMPTRYAHWSFGKAYHRMKTQYDYNLSRIYELVFNSDPCYAFLLDGNALVQNKLVAAHVLAHSDFFKNNYRFCLSNRRMIETMSVHAQRIRDYEFRYGRRPVEIFLDAVMALAEHIDPYNPGLPDEKKVEERPDDPSTPYDDLWQLGVQSAPPGEETVVRKFPREPRQDLLGFLMQYADDLEDWQRDIIGMAREEMLYFWPQMETKVMNEGWAAYWHLRIVREMDLTEAEAIEFAKLHAGVLQGSRTRLNPYLLGMKMFEDIERRWDNPSLVEREKYGRPGGQGRAKIFEVRATETDISFLRNYLTKQLVEDLDLYLYEKVGHEWVVTERDWERVRDGLVQSLVNCGFPTVMVADGDYQHNGELYLQHAFEGVELDLPYLEKTLPYAYQIWGRPVHLETKVEGKDVLFSYDGKKNSRRTLAK